MNLRKYAILAAAAALLITAPASSQQKQEFVKIELPLVEGKPQDGTVSHRQALLSTDGCRPGTARVLIGGHTKLNIPRGVSECYPVSK